MNSDLESLAFCRTGNNRLYSREPFTRLLSEVVIIVVEYFVGRLTGKGVTLWGNSLVPPTLSLHHPVTQALYEPRIEK